MGKKLDRLSMSVGLVLYLFDYGSDILLSNTGKIMNIGGSG